ncbi:MAG: 5-formyltetrahydrofolate cyclo-ligase [Treponema sp.]|nr:5-formyltetrahydrofolate cyclo-ligase [Treponema sp.]
MTKKELRKIMKQKLNSIPKQQFSYEGGLAAKRLTGTRIWSEYGRILIYLSMPDELDTSALLETAFAEGKDVYSPKVETDTSMRFFRVTRDESSWIKGAFDIREPAGREEDVFKPEDGKALVISPGLAFDRSGNRMGRGKGFYDRFYEKLFAASPASACCAFCLNCQIIDDVPVEQFDRKVNAICTMDEFIQITDSIHAGV